MIRLLVDDEDVTARTTQREGRLEYNPADLRWDDRLAPHWHTATVLANQGTVGRSKSWYVRGLVRGVESTR
jgi:hypothetical protein